MAAHRVIFGLGSNWGDREAQLSRAILSLSQGLEEVAVSGIYESAALLPPDAPKEWDMVFLNMAVAGHTELAARKLLLLAKRLEREIGRQDRGFWGPREIDIDILAYGETVIREPDLVIPHPALLERDFALLPLAEIAPDWRYPGEGEFHGMTAAEIAARRGYRENKGLRRRDCPLATTEL